MTSSSQNKTEIIGFEGSFAHPRPGIVRANGGVAIIKFQGEIYNSASDQSVTEKRLQHFTTNNVVTLMPDPFVCEEDESDWFDTSWSKKSWYVYAVDYGVDLPTDLALLAQNNHEGRKITEDKNGNQVLWFLFSSKEQREQFGNNLQEHCLEFESLSRKQLRDKEYVIKVAFCFGTKSGNENFEELWKRSLKTRG